MLLAFAGHKRTAAPWVPIGDVAVSFMHTAIAARLRAHRSRDLFSVLGLWRVSKKKLEIRLPSGCVLGTSPLAVAALEGCAILVAVDTHQLRISPACVLCVVMVM